ncbi:MAG: MATE family efflux transporter [Ruminiclostridium sp.]|nr:MATE family efflux transporter [Ruminiclostridium sp.]
MNISLSEHFGYGKLLRFTLPSVGMMIMTSVYGVVDGYFVSNYVGLTPFAAVNLIMPFLMILGGTGFMFGSGGSALIAKTLGEGKKELANKTFSLLVYSAAALGVIFSVLGIAVLRPVSALLGAEGELLENCVRYGRIYLASMPFYLLQYTFQSFFISAEKPRMGLLVTIAAGVTNMALDALFVAVFEWGLEGAASATAISITVGGVIPLIYFFRKNTSLFRLGKTRFDGKALLKTCTNGSSELMSNISMSIVNMLYNFQLNKYAGENGIAAYGVMMYVNLVFLAIFIGYSVGTAPIISYHYGAENKDELKSLLKKSAVIIWISSVAMIITAQILAYPLAKIFVGYDEALMKLTLDGFRIFSVSFLFAGTAIFGSSFFTALNDGLTSALISFLRTLVFQTAAVLILPVFFDVDGVWFSVAAAEFTAAAVTMAFIFGKKKKYGYL